MLFLYEIVRDQARAVGGKVLVTPLRLRVTEGKFREPDLVMLRDASDPRRQNPYWLGADLVLEVISPDRPERDLTEKRLDYAEAGIPEYWMVNPLDQTLTVLTLCKGCYVEHGRFERGQVATSSLLPDLQVDVASAFDAP